MSTLQPMTDDEFDEMRMLLTQARNGRSIDRERFRFLLKRFSDLEEVGKHVRLAAGTVLVSGGQAGQNYKLPMPAPGENIELDLDLPSGKLGAIQRTVLKELRARGEWFPGCGWRWNTLKETERLLVSLIARGYARKEGFKYFPVEKSK